MTGFLSSFLELIVIWPGLLLSYLPMKQYLKWRPLKVTALMLPLTLLLCLAGSAVSICFSVRVWILFLAIAFFTGAVYIGTLNITRWKSVSVYLAVCGAFSCLRVTATSIDVVVCLGNNAPWLSLPASAAYFLMCCVFVLLAWYPATHAARVLLDDNTFAQTWYVFWVLPILFIGLNCAMHPIHQELLNLGRFLSMYTVVSLAMLFLLALFYFLFYLMAESLNKNHFLRQQNLFLSMQQARYDSLKAAIDETREARHDMRHHFDAMQALAAQEEWGKLTEYLAEARGKLPDAELHLCDNTTIDAVAGHYALMYRKEGIPFSFLLDLPETLPVPETDLCLILSNLLENAYEASLRTAADRRKVSVRACLHLENMVLLSVENTFDGNIKIKNGIYLSSKRRGEGLGIQSIRRIAEKNDGYSRFSHENGIFRANILLHAREGA